MAACGRRANGPGGDREVHDLRTPQNFWRPCRRCSTRSAASKPLVNGKTIAIKVNLTGAPESRVNDQPVGDTHYTHPQVIAATVHLIGKAGARRIRVLESPMATVGPIEEYVARANWQPRDILVAAANVEFENTNFLGNARKYPRLIVPSGGLLFPAFDLNHSYEDCDVYVSLAKMKEHGTAGITLSMKNSFGVLPSSIYGTGAGKDEPDENPKGNRQSVHTGALQPARTAPAEKDPTSPREGATACRASLWISSRPGPSIWPSSKACAR